MISDQDEGMVPRSNNKNNKRCKTLKGLLHTCQLSFNWLDLTSQQCAERKNTAWCKTSHTNCAKEAARHIATAYCTEGKEKLPPAARKRKLPPAAQEKSCLLQQERKAASCSTSEKLPPAARKKSCLLQQKGKAATYSEKEKAASCSTREKLPPAARKKSCLLQQKGKAASRSVTERNEAEQHVYEYAYRF